MILASGSNVLRPPRTTLPATESREDPKMNVTRPAQPRSTPEPSLRRRAVGRAAATTLEALEERRLMTVAFAEGGIVVTGTGNADDIVVETQPFSLPGMVQVRVKEEGVTTLNWIPFG